MASFRYLLNKYVELIFKDAIANKGYAKALLYFSSFFSKVPYGLWCFRIGEISKSLSLLKKANQNISVVRACINRSEEILLKINQTLPENQKHTNFQLDRFNHKILFACHSNGYYHPNGYAYRTKEIAQALSEKQVKIHAITRPGYPWDLAECMQLQKVDSTEFGGLTFRHFEDKERAIAGQESIYIDMYADLIVDELKKSNCSIIHAHSNYLNGHAAAKAGNRLGIPSVFEMRGLWHLSRAVKEPIFEDTEHYKYCEKMEIEAAILCDHVVTLNYSLKKWLISKGVNKNKISVVPNSVHLREMHETKTDNNKDYIFGFAGSITAYEGLDDLVEAISLLKKKGIYIKLKIAGSGAYFSNLKKLISDHNLGDEIELLGRIPGSEIEAFYNTVDAIVIPRKNFKVTRLVTPLKLVEAMNYGKPIVCSDLPALKEVVSDGQDGLLFQSDSVEDLALKLQDVMNMPDKGLSLSNAAHKKIANDFNWQKSASGYIKIYTEFFKSGSIL